LKSAFGSDEAVKLIKQLLPQTDSLAENIGKINKTTGMDKAADMAARRVDVFARWSEGIQAVRIGLGQALLPVLIPAVEKLTQGAGAIYDWTQRFPGLTKAVGLGIAVIAGGAGVFGAFAAMGGLARLAMFGMGQGTLFARAATLVWNLAVKATTVIMAVFRGGLVAARTAMLAMNAAMYANPVGLVVAGVLLLTAGVAAAIYYWDDLKAAFLDSAWGQAIIGVVDKVLGSLKSLWEMITKILDKIPSMSGAWGWIKGKIPGMGDDAAVAPASSPSLDAPRQGSAVNGGAARMISNAVNTDNRRNESRSVHIGQVVTSRPINPQEIGNQLWMAGG
jgi:hypothetical protein